MRYVVLVILGVVSVILSGSVMNGISIAGIQVDLVLLIVLSLALCEKTVMPIIFAAATGLFMDIMYSDVLGTYALCYTIVAILVMTAFRKAGRFNVLFLFLVGAGGYLVKELLMALFVLAGGTSFDFLPILLNNILPGALVSGLLLFAAYWLVSRLMRNNFMRPRASYRIDEF